MFHMVYEEHSLLVPLPYIFFAYDGTADQVLNDIGWMACVWVYPPEILPLKIRGKGAALAVATDFVGNFLVRICPICLGNSQ
jgi:Sugar (and other) transporter